MTQKLPTSRRHLNVGALAGIFHHTTNSYKYLFFGALLEACARRRYAAGSISLSDLVVHMLLDAWYLHGYFRVSFGAQDQIGLHLDRLDLDRTALREPETARAAIARVYRDKGLDILLRYVPARLLSPFFREELHGCVDAKRNAFIVDLAAAQFDTRRPLYRLRDDCIDVHPDWLDYFRENAAIVKGWARWSWLDYLQRRNPSVPALSMKLEPPAVRRLGECRGWWKKILSGSDLRCIYTDQPLSPEDFALDHFVPWSFVAHDHSWNLVPVPPPVNASKGDALPDERFIAHLSRFQVRALRVAQERLEPKEWRKLTESFIADLRLGGEEDIFNPACLDDAYRDAVRPLLQVARGMGFPAGWTPSRAG